MFYKTGGINDPLGQTHSNAISEHFFCCFVLLYLKSDDGQTDGQRATYAKTIIPTGRDFGLAEWINLRVRRIIFVEVKKLLYVKCNKTNN